MAQSPLTRRTFLQTTTVAAVSSCLHPSPVQAGQVIPTRPNVAGLDQTSANMLTYAGAVKEMRARSAANVMEPLGWTFWANIHGMPASDSTNHPAWRQCDHGTRWFFPWHRGYLMFFERIIRKVSGDSSFVLPYWKWEDPASRSLPSLFRMPAHPVFKELFHPRFTAINNGNPLPAGPFEVDLPNSMEEISFDPVSTFDPGFSRYFDGTPHGPVHTRTGGEMQSISTSARDPIFWLHHANVDRLWNRWLGQGMGRANPTDEEWLDTPLRSNGDKKPILFPDETGAIVQLKVKEVLDMAKVAYRYDDDPVAPLPTPPVLAVLASQASPRGSTPLASASNSLFVLGDQKSTITIALGTTGSERLKTSVKRLMAADAIPRRSPMFLELQGVQVDAPDPDVDYDVLIRPKGSNQPGQYVGNLNFFSVHEHAKEGKMAHSGEKSAMSLPKFDVSFNISKAMRKLTNDGVNTITDLDVMFQPSSRPENAKPLPRIGFERIVVQAAR